MTPLAFESFSFDDYNVVISITSAEAKGIITKPKTMYVCYCLTPTRYLWSHENEYLNRPGFGILDPVVKMFAKPILTNLKEGDKIACQRPDYYLAISKNVAERIKKYYCRESEVIYPPVDLEKFKMQKSNIKMTTQKSKSYFLVVSRLVGYKKVDLVVNAFNELRWPLKIVGTGREMERLKRMAKPNIEFLGELTDRELLSYYQNCQALICPQEEDFGIVAVEAQASGRPVIAYNGGGVKEIVIEGVTGEFFYPQTKETLIKKLKKFKTVKYKREDCYRNAERFSQERFKVTFKNKIEKLFIKYSNNFSFNTITL